MTLNLLWQENFQTLVSKFNYFGENHGILQITRVLEQVESGNTSGGLGTRISEETSLRPKPMIEIGGRPILWHILKIYSHFGVNDFIICCGYKGYVIKEYFANYFLHSSDVTIDMKTNSMEVHSRKAEPWKVTLVDTGENTLTVAD